MKILKILTLRGPNYWSIRRPKLIVARIDLEEFAERTTDTIPGFYDALVNRLPSLVEHFCSPGHRGGFLKRIEKGTLLGHVTEHIALELQELAGMSVGFGRARSTAEPGVYNVVFEYRDERAGRYALRAAVRMCESLVATGHYPDSEFDRDLEDLRELWAEAALGPSTESIVKAAEDRGIPWKRLSARSMIQLGYGCHQRRIQATLTDGSSILGVELACDKEGTKMLLADASIPVPRGTVIQYLEDLEEAIESVGGYPIVIKPLDGNHGRGITIDIDNWEDAEVAYDAASEESKTRSVIIERFYKGSDHRVLVIDGKLVAVAERIPAHVVGDGRSTISELIEETNRDPRRGDGHDNMLTRLKLDRLSLQRLARQGLRPESIPNDGEICYLRATANLSTGGVAIDRTDEIHPENVWIAQRVAKLIGLDIIGMDFVTTDISKPLRETDGVIVEVNAAPGFRMHVSPSEGKSRDVAGATIDMLFPPGKPHQCPIFSITGTNGKTTTTRLIAHLARQTGKVVGYTTTDGTYIGDFLAEAGDNTGPQSAHLILGDPSVEIAVLETARGGIIRSGLAFERSDVGVVLNVAADHLGLGDINTIEQMAQVKGVVAETVSPNGYGVLNADDPLVTAMRDLVRGTTAFFSMNPENEVIRDHVEQGGIAAIYEDGWLIILNGTERLPVEEAVNVPLTLKGMAPFMIANALAATLATYVQGIDLDAIRQGLRTFTASVDQTPGRMNLFDMGSYHALVDYAHNAASYEALGGFIANWPGKCIGVVGGPGDRRDEDLEELGRLSAGMFDHIIVKEDDDTRGRERGSAAEWIVRGIESTESNCTFETILKESKAIDIALKEAPRDSLVTILPESVTRAIEAIESHRSTSSTDTNSTSGFTSEAPMSQS
jgi:cyanophycin synthetase